MSTTYHRPRTIFVIAVLISVIAGAVPFARADGEVALMNRVNAALRGNDRLNGAKAYTAAPGVIVLYGMVFDDKDRALAEQTANGVSGVTQVVDLPRCSKRRCHFSKAHIPLIKFKQPVALVTLANVKIIPRAPLSR
jgi:hypothetical protein